jgi:Ca-activated chloride channel family protein
MRRYSMLVLAVALAGAHGGCASDAALDPDIAGPTGSRGVTQGGAQDIAYFRSIVERGEVPQPDTIEPVGFFAEHAVDLPAADCGDDVCMHAMLAVAPGIDRTSNWTMAFVALNSPVDPRELERPATHVVLVIEDTQRAELFASNAESAIRAFTAELVAGDLVSIVRVGTSAEVLANGVEPSDAALAEAVSSFNALAPAAALYDGLATASQLATNLEGFDGAHRVVLVTSGIADAGVTDSMRIVALGEALGSAGIGTSVIGLGSAYRPELAMQLSEAGGGSYYFAENADDLVDIVTIEGRTSLYPLATDFELVVEAAAGYRVGRIYGARRAWSEQAAAYLTSPVLMVGNRTGSTDTTDGRRGGGGGLFVELIADAALGAEIGPFAPAFTARATFLDASSGTPISQEIVVENGLAPGENPGGMFPHFSDPARGKAFMMLNMYLALRSTAELFQGGNCGQSLGVVPALAPTYEGWQMEWADPDIDADWLLLTDLTDNVQAQCGAVEPVAPIVPMSCFHD